MQNSDVRVIFLEFFKMGFLDIAIIVYYKLDGLCHIQSIVDRGDEIRIEEDSFASGLNNGVFKAIFTKIFISRGDDYRLGGAT